MRHQVSVNGSLVSTLDATTSLQAVAKFMDEFVPPEERLVFRGNVLGPRVIIRTTNMVIIVEPVVSEAMA